MTYRVILRDDPVLSFKTKAGIRLAFPNFCDLKVYWLETQQEKGKGRSHPCLPFKYLKYFVVEHHF